VLVKVFGVPYFKRRVEKDFEQASLITNMQITTPEEPRKDSDLPAPDPVPEYLRTVYRIFVPLQILTSALVAFAHGANDVANAIGPFSAILAVWQNGSIPDSTETPVWLLIIGGAAIVLGLSTLGYRVMATMGTKITTLDPVCGFAAQFAGAFTVMGASWLGYPISTTHTLVGAITGVGLVSGVKNLNWKVIRNIGASWVITIPAGVILSILLFLVLRAML